MQHLGRGFPGLTQVALPDTAFFTDIAWQRQMNQSDAAVQRHAGSDTAKIAIDGYVCYDLHHAHVSG